MVANVRGYTDQNIRQTLQQEFKMVANLRGYNDQNIQQRLQQEFKMVANLRDLIIRTSDT